MRGEEGREGAQPWDRLTGAGRAPASSPQGDCAAAPPLGNRPPPQLPLVQRPVNQLRRLPSLPLVGPSRLSLGASPPHLPLSALAGSPRNPLVRPPGPIRARAVAFAPFIGRVNGPHVWAGPSSFCARRSSEGARALRAAGGGARDGGGGAAASAAPAGSRGAGPSARRCG